MPAIGETGDRRRPLRDQIVVIQCAQAGDIRAGIQKAHEVFRRDAPGQAVPAAGVSHYHPPADKAPQLHVETVRGKVGYVRKFRDGEDGLVIPPPGLLELHI